MSPEPSVTQWFHQLQAGNRQAAQALWERYYERMVRSARQRLQNHPRRLADEEDVALHAFDSFCRDAERGRYPDITDRHDLWKLLLAITAQKGIDLVRHEAAAKRGGGAEAIDVERLLSREPGPDFAAEVAEECDRLLRSLKDDGLRSVALSKMEGYTNEEIAVRMSCTPRTIERRLRIIRQIWSEEGSK